MSEIQERNKFKRIFSLLSFLNAFLAAVQFLTIIPPLVRRPFTSKELGQAVGFYPLVGAAIGGILLVANNILAIWFPSAVQSALTLALWILLTGALHLDGLLDTFDGLFGGHTVENRLRILRDECIGAFALAGGVSTLLIKFSALDALLKPDTGLLLAPILGRWGMSLALVAFPYARPTGLGSDIKENVTRRQFVLATAIALLAAWICADWTGLVMLAIAGFFVVVISRYTIRRINGLTGDIYGALNELIETIILLGLVFFQANQLQ
jgi:adenosylcobinamide-GDP ribazoletransferase